jgi:hypothetical protein
MRKLNAKDGVREQQKVQCKSKLPPAENFFKLEEICVELRFVSKEET